MNIVIIKIESQSTLPPHPMLPKEATNICRMVKGRTQVWEWNAAHVPMQGHC
jgi:hypothetical protein